MGAIGCVRFMFQEKGEIVIEREVQDENDAKKFQKMLDLFEEDGDVQEVYHNAEFPEGWDE